MRVKTWVARRCTPILHHSFDRTQLSLLARVSFRKIDFHFFYDALKASQLVEVLVALADAMAGTLLHIVDSLPAYRCRGVRECVEPMECGIVFERLPCEAPEFNQAEYFFAYTNKRELTNLLVDNIAGAKRYAWHRLNPVQRQSRLTPAFWNQAESPLFSVTYLCKAR